MKTKALVLILFAVLLIAPSCKKQKAQWSKHVVTEEYVFVDPQNKEEKDVTKCPEKKEKEPKLWQWKAKSLVKSLLKEEKIINHETDIAIETGFYQCDDINAREKLYKTKVNGLVDVTFSEIKNKYERPTYWVEVALTPAGQALIVDDYTNLFPEDTINYEHMLTVLSPETGKNQYGEYTFDPNVDSTIIELISNFYYSYISDKNTAINAYGTDDLIKAHKRITTAKDLGLNRMSKDPFLRNKKFNAANIDALSIVKWTSFVDLYIVTIDNQEFCFVIKDNNGIYRIDDIALNTPDKLNNKKTMRCVALNISAKEMHIALLKQEKALAKTQKVRRTPKKIQKADESSLLFDEYNPQLQPGLVEVVHTEPTLYELAKQCEHFDVYRLVAGEYKFKKITKAQNVNLTYYELFKKFPELIELYDVEYEDKALVKKAKVTIERTNVTPIGRIYYGMKEGETKTLDVLFYYANGEWGCKLLNY